MRMKFKVNKISLEFAAWACAFVFFIACGENGYGVVVHDECPENTICDTTYVDAEAYSFVIYSGKNKLDTVTAMTDEMTCDIEDFYFRCTWKEVYSTCRVVYSKDIDDVKTESRDSVVHKKVEVKRIDTTFINYGKIRMVDYIPPYVETPKLDKKKLRDAMDTVVIGPDEKYKDEYYGKTEFFESGYYIEDAHGLPYWAYSSSHTSGLSYDENGAVYFDYVEVSYCSETVITRFPLALKTYSSYLYAILYEPLERDTTVTWTAYYTDLYGVKDSTEITTVFTMKKE